MDCCFADQYDSSQIVETFPNVSSPEMFDSDTESDIDNKNIDVLADNDTLAAIPPQEPTQAELIAKSDSCMLVRINKYLSGVPPPPRHTTCQSDCSDFLRHIYENRQLFCNGYPFNGNSESIESTKPEDQRTRETNARNVSYQCTKGTPRNLTNAFNTCDLSSTNEEGTKLINKSDSDNSNVQSSVSKEITNSVNMIKETVKVPSIVNNANVSHKSPLLYYTIGEKEAKALTWPQAFFHKFHGIQ